MLRFAALALTVMACQSSPETRTDSGPPPAATPDVASAPEGAAESREGTLVFDPIPPTKSVRAYLGDDLRLESDGTALVLAPSAAVSRDALIAQAGKRVSIKALRHAPTPPSPDESYPTDMDGKPMQRPARWEVLELTPLAR